MLLIRVKASMRSFKFVLFCFFNVQSSFSISGKLYEENISRIYSIYFTLYRLLNSYIGLFILQMWRDYSQKRTV